MPAANPNAMIPPVEVPAIKSTCANHPGTNACKRSNKRVTNTPFIPPPSMVKIRYVIS
jgi:hypothetical protein